MSNGCPVVGERRHKEAAEGEGVQRLSVSNRRKAIRVEPTREAPLPTLAPSAAQRGIPVVETRPRSPADASPS